MASFDDLISYVTFLSHVDWLAPSRHRNIYGREPQMRRAFFPFRTQYQFSCLNLEKWQVAHSSSSGFLSLKKQKWHRKKKQGSGTEAWDFLVPTAPDLEQGMQTWYLHFFFREQAHVKGHLSWPFLVLNVNTHAMWLCIQRGLHARQLRKSFRDLPGMW
jgi:hypothetical protein